MDLVNVTWRKSQDYPWAYHGFGWVGKDYARIYVWHTTKK